MATRTSVGERLRTYAFPPLSGKPHPRLRAFRRRISRTRLLTPLIIAILVWLVIAPLILSTLSSFRLTVNFLPFESGARWTLQNYYTVFFTPATYTVLFNTLLFSGGSLALDFAISIALALLIERTDMPGRSTVFVLLVASLGIPSVISGMAWDLLLNPTNGLINLVIRSALPMFHTGPLNIYTMAGMIFAQALSMVPITYLLIGAAFRSMDATMEDAGFAAGASRLQVLRRITLPILTPAFFSALIFQFIIVVSSFELPLIIGLPAGIDVLSTVIYVNTQSVTALPNYGVSSAYSMLLMLIALAPLFYYSRVTARAERFVTISARGYQPTRIALRAWRKVAAIAFVAIFTLFNFILPIFVMLWASIQPFFSTPSLDSLKRITFAAYNHLFNDPDVGSTAINTAIIGAVSAVATMVLAMLVSWILVRTRSRLRVVLDVLSFLPAALPGVTVGLSVLLFYLILPLPFTLYGTIWIIIIGLTTQSISLGVRLMTGGISQIDRALEEAADVSGASRLTTMRRVVLPLVRPVFLNGCLLVFMTSVQYLTVPLMLFSPGNSVLSVSIWNYWNDAQIAPASALGMLMVIVTIPMSYVLHRFSRSASL